MLLAPFLAGSLMAGLGSVSAAKAKASADVASDADKDMVKSEAKSLAWGYSISAGFFLLTALIMFIMVFVVWSRRM